MGGYGYDLVMASRPAGRQLAGTAVCDVDGRRTDGGSPLRRAGQIDLLLRRADILCPADRALVLMHLEKGSRFCDIAQVTGLNEATVARRIHKLVKRLLDDDYVTCLRHRSLLGKTNLAIAKDHFIEGLSMRRIAEKRRITVYRVRKGLLRIRRLLDGRLETEQGRRDSGTTEYKTAHPGRRPNEDLSHY